MKSDPLLFKGPGTIRCNKTDCSGNLCYLTNEQKSKTKGLITLNCNECGLKHFAVSQAELKAIAAHQARVPEREEDAKH